AEEAEARDILADDEQADGHWCREEQADGPPYPCPEYSRDEKREIGDARSGAVEPDLDDVVAHDLHHDEEQDRVDEGFPTRSDGRGEGDGEDRGDPGAEKRDEAEQGGEQPPEQGV